MRLLKKMRPELTQAQILADLTQLLSNRVQPAFISFNQLVKSSAFARLQAQNKQAQVDPYDSDLMEVGPKNRGPLYRKHKELTLTVASAELKALSADPATTSSTPAIPLDTDSAATPARASASSTLSFAPSGNLAFHGSNPFARPEAAAADTTAGLALTPATTSDAAETSAPESSAPTTKSKPTSKATSGALALDGLALSPAAAESSGTLLATSNAAPASTDSGLALTPATAPSAAETTASKASAPAAQPQPTSKATSGALTLGGLALSPAAAQSSGTLLATSNASSSGTDSGLDLTPATAPSAVETTTYESSAPAAQPQPTSKATSGALTLGGLALSPAAAQSSEPLLETSATAAADTNAGLALTPATARGAVETTAPESSTSTTKSDPTAKADSGALALDGLALSPAAAQSSGTLLATSNASSSGTDSGLDLTPATARGAAETTVSEASTSAIQSKPTPKDASGALALGGLALSPAAAESSAALLDPSNAAPASTDSGLALTPATAPSAAETTASKASAPTTKSEPTSKVDSGALALGGLAVSPAAAQSSETLLETSATAAADTNEGLALTPATARDATAPTAAAAAVAAAPVPSAVRSDATAEAKRSDSGGKSAELSLEAVPWAAPEFDLSADAGNSELAAQASLWRQEQAQTERVAAQLAPTQPPAVPTKAKTKSRATGESTSRKSKKGEPSASKRADKHADKGTGKGAGKRHSEREPRTKLDFSGAPATEGRVWRQSDLSERFAQENSSANWVNSMVRARYGASSAHAHFDERVKIFSRRSDNTTTERTIADIRAERQRRLDAELNSPSFQSLVAAKAAQRAAELAAQASAAAQATPEHADAAPDARAQAPAAAAAPESGAAAPAAATKPTPKGVRPVKYVAPTLEMVSVTQASPSAVPAAAPEPLSADRLAAESAVPENSAPELNAASLELNLGGDTSELILTAAENHSLWTSFLGSGDEIHEDSAALSPVTLWHNTVAAVTSARTVTKTTPDAAETAPAAEDATAQPRANSAPATKPRLARSSSRPTANVRRSALGTAWIHAKAPTTADLAQDLEPEMRKALVKYGFLPDPAQPAARAESNHAAASSMSETQAQAQAQTNAGASPLPSTPAPWDVPLTTQTSNSANARAQTRTKVDPAAATSEAAAPTLTEASTALAPESTAAPDNTPRAEGARTSSAETASSAPPLFDFVNSTLDPAAAVSNSELAEVAAAASAAWDESAAPANTAATTSSAVDEDLASAETDVAAPAAAKAEPEAKLEAEPQVEVGAEAAAHDGAPWPDNVGPADHSNCAVPYDANAESTPPAAPTARRRTTKAPAQSAPADLDAKAQDEPTTNKRSSSAKTAPSRAKAHEELDDIAHKLVAGEATLLDQDERAQINAAAAAALFGAAANPEQAEDHAATTSATAGTAGVTSEAAGPEVDEMEMAARIKRARELRRQAAQGRMVFKEIRTLLRANHRSLSEIPTDAEFDALSPAEQARMTEQALTLLASLRRELGVKTTTPRPAPSAAATTASSHAYTASIADNEDNAEMAESDADNQVTASAANEVSAVKSDTVPSSADSPAVTARAATATTALSPEAVPTTEVPHYNHTVAAAYEALAQTEHGPLELNAAQMQQVLQDFQVKSSGIEELNANDATERKVIAAQHVLQAKAKLRRFAREVNAQQYKPQASAAAGVSSNLNGISGSLLQHPTEERELTAEELEQLRAQEQRRFIRPNYSEYNHLSAHELKATEVQATALSAPVQRLALSGITEPPLSTHLGRNLGRLTEEQPGAAANERSGDEGLSAVLPKSVSALYDIFWEGAGMEGETTEAAADASATAARAPDPLLDLEFDASSPFSLELQELDALLMSRPELTTLKYHWLYGHYFLLTQAEYLQLLDEPSAALTAQAQDAGLSAAELAALVRRERTNSQLCAQLRPFRELNVMRRVMLELNEHQPSEHKLIRLQRGKFNYYLRLLGRNFYLTANAHRLKAGFDPELERITNLNAQRVDDEVKFVLATILLSGYNLYLKAQAHPLTDTYRALNFKPPL